MSSEFLDIIWAGYGHQSSTQSLSYSGDMQNSVQEQN